MIIFSTPRSGSTFYNLELEKANTTYKNFGEIVHWKTVKEYLEYSGDKMFRIHAHHLMENYRLLDQFKNNHCHILCPREDYVEQYLSYILVSHEHYHGKWADYETSNVAEDYFEGIRVPYIEALDTVYQFSMWLQDWCLLSKEIMKYSNYSVHKFEDFTKSNKSGKFWKHNSNKLKYIEKPDKVIEEIHRNYSKWNLDVDLNGTKELLTLNQPRKSESWYHQE
jgi:hypothetical protein